MRNYVAAFQVRKQRAGYIHEPSQLKNWRTCLSEPVVCPSRLNIWPCSWSEKKLNIDFLCWKKNVTLISDFVKSELHLSAKAIAFDR